MQMYDIVATGVLGLLVGFWSGRSIRWKMEETEEMCIRDSHYPEILSRKLCRGLYHNTAAAWTIKSQKELDEARKHFDIFIFDSFVPEAGK